jgi:hypothetical protein
MRSRGRGDPHLSGMNLDLNDEEAEALATQYFKSEKGNNFFIYNMLIDINDNRIIGELMTGRGEAKPGGCAVAGGGCSSEKEWEAMIKPYMEE